MIAIQNLTFSYPTGNFRLEVAGLSVTEREKVAVIGPSGTGKTTLLNLIGGILPCRSGQVLVDGQDIGSFNDRQRRQFRISRIGFIFQDFALLDYLNGYDNILHPYRISKTLILDAAVRARAVDLAGELGIGDKLQQYPSRLSQGEQQRVAIGRALLTQPRLILADEATGNLDPENKNRILEQLFTGVDNHDATLLAVTHDHELLPNFDRVVDFRDFLVGAAP
jgi:putative ABC transport system ATP-binding protein